MKAIIFLFHANQNEQIMNQTKHRTFLGTILSEFHVFGKRKFTAFMYTPSKAICHFALSSTIGLLIIGSNAKKNPRLKRKLQKLFMSSKDGADPDGAARCFRSRDSLKSHPAQHWNSSFLPVCNCSLLRVQEKLVVASDSTFGLDVICSPGIEPHVASGSS